MDDLRDVGNVHCMHGGLYEWAHTFVMEEYRMTSKSVETTMDEILDRMNRHAAIVNSNKPNRTGCSCKNNVRENAVWTDGGFFIQSGYRKKFANLENSRRITADGGTHIDRSVAKLSSALGDGGMRNLITCIRELLTDSRGVPASFARHITLQLPASTYVSRY